MTEPQQERSLSPDPKPRPTSVAARPVRRRPSTGCCRTAPATSSGPRGRHRQAHHRLVERGLDVVAVDPIAGDARTVARRPAATPALLGTAEQIPLRDNSVDAVLVAQAWLVRPEAGNRRGGRVPAARWAARLVWNTRDERDGLGQDLGRVIGLSDPFSDRVTLPEPFTGRAPPRRVDELP